MFDPKSDDYDIPGALRVMARCEQLASYSSMENAVCRTYLTPEQQVCNRVVGNWMQNAGMRTWVDQVGNCWGHYAGNTGDAPIVLLGSHLDTVSNAGKYDGILGVLAAIDVVERLHRENRRLPFAIEVVGFADEEGTRFGATLLGSRAVAGQWRDEWLQLKDAHGIDLATAMSDFGLDPTNVHLADRSRDDIRLYLELHIEQGPMLVKHNQPVGLVSAIAGARRFIITMDGKAGHAGTVPMELRRDPLIAAALAVADIESIAKNMRVVATVGRIETYPGSVNVIPGQCKFSLDVRSGIDDSRDLAVDAIFAQIKALARERDLGFSVEEIHNAGAVQCASWLQRLIEDVIQEQGLQPVSMVSGAGHDAMVFGESMDMGMIFVRCAEGISHHPDEAVSIEDVQVALDLYYAALVALAENERFEVTNTAPVNEGNS